MRRIFVIAEAFPPAERAGGPVRSLFYMVMHFAPESELYVYTRDREYGDCTPFRDIVSDCWQQIAGFKVLYVSPELFYKNVWREIQSISPDVIYVNSYFSRMARRLLWTHRARRTGATILLAPRGEFHSGALSLKPLKKRCYIMLCRAFGVNNGIIFHATSDQEVTAIREVIGGTAKIVLAQNFSGPPLPKAPSNLRKNRGSVKLVFCSRVVRKKNVLFALELLNACRGQIELCIYGPNEDLKYMQELRATAKAVVPPHVVTFGGALAPDNVEAVLSRYHIFVLPTLGENHGHVIVEAWSAGLPVLLSDQTPWRHLQDEGVGWDIPLADREAWIAAINYAVELDGTAYDMMRTKSFIKAQKLRSKPPTEQWRQMWKAVCGNG